jgi:hypothetical protein
MRLRHLPLILAAASLGAPAIAAPNAASSLSVAKAARAAAPTANGSKMVSGSAVYALAGFLAVVATVVTIKLVTDDDDSDSN